MNANEAKEIAFHQADGERIGDHTKARIFYPDGRIDEWVDSAMAYAVYMALDKGIRAAFRAAGNKTPVYPHDYVDRI